MLNDTATDKLSKELEQLVRNKLEPLFSRYGLDLTDLLSPLKWKPLVLIIGNYSSGKSTFINELLGENIQRTGQAPTDDCFTILTAPGKDELAGDIPGSTVISDERLPFEFLRRFGESLISHLRLKKIESPVLQNFAIIDTPGMLDSVTEKDRGYDYLGVVGELAKLADIIVLMFDPFKAGTIKETYKAIRSTLPESTGEDRVMYVLNRIDECENALDLLRSYGTLCWNLSQMTGRKDMPRIFLTYAPDMGDAPPGIEPWMNEREELKKTLDYAPRMRLSHLLQEIDRIVRELALEIEALASFRSRLFGRLKRIVRSWGTVAVTGFFLGDLATNAFTGYPATPLLKALISGEFGLDHFIWPILWVMLVCASASMYFQKLLFPGFVKTTLGNIDALIPRKDAYEWDLWRRIKPRVRKKIEEQARKQIWIAHDRHLSGIKAFLDRDLPDYYERVQSK
ncbi:MAG TPA: dynamin family protein [Thermodesulfobacteriaceae bacterium]|nr:dynamin family protein [Thermodesulfobacteriaceae bacterium]